MNRDYCVFREYNLSYWVDLAGSSWKRKHRVKQSMLKALDLSVITEEVEGEFCLRQ